MISKYTHMIALEAVCVRRLPRQESFQVRVSDTEQERYEEAGGAYMGIIINGDIITVFSKFGCSRITIAAYA